MSEGETAVAEARPAEVKTAKAVYLLYLLAPLVSVLGAFVHPSAGVLALAMEVGGLVMAYVNKPSGHSWLDSHFVFQIRTFWIGLLLSFIALLPLLAIAADAQFALILMVLLGAGVIIWWIARCVKGMQRLDQNKAILDPQTWGFG